MLHVNDRRDWGKWLEAAQVAGVDADHGPIFNQASMAIDAAIDGQGVALARTALAATPIRNCRFELSADGRLPFPDASFDAVLSTDTFEHVMDLDLAFVEIARVLRRGKLSEMHGRYASCLFKDSELQIQGTKDHASLRVPGSGTYTRRAPP